MSKYLSIFVLSVLACSGNYFSLELFFGVDLLWGSVFVIIALFFLGLWPGLLVAVLSAGYTYFLWGHPYAFIILVLEAVTLGLFLKKSRQTNLIYFDLLFWVGIGMPSCLLLYTFCLSLPLSTVFFVMVKQAANGVTNAIIAYLFILLLSRKRKFFWRHKTIMPVEKVPLDSFLTLLLSLVIMIPAMITATLLNREESRKTIAMMQVSAEHDAVRAAQATQTLLLNKKMILLEYLQLQEAGLEVAEVPGDFISLTRGDDSLSGDVQKGSIGGTAEMGRDTGSPLDDSSGYLYSLQKCPSGYEGLCLVLTLVREGGNHIQGILSHNYIESFLNLFSHHGEQVAYRLSHLPPDDKSHRKDVHFGTTVQANTRLKHFSMPPEEDMPKLLRWQGASWNTYVPIVADKVYAHVEVKMAPVIRKLRMELSKIFISCLLPAFLVLLVSPILRRMISAPILWLSNISQRLVAEDLLDVSDEGPTVRRATSIMEELDTLAGNFFTMVRSFQEEKQKNIALLQGLEKSEGQIRELQNISEDAIITVNHDLQLTHYNHGAEKLFGYSREEVIGQHLNILVPERFRARHIELVREFAEGEVYSKRIGGKRRITGQKKDGSEIIAEASIAKTKGSSEVIMTAILRDVTELVLKEGRQKAQSAMLSFLSSNEAWFADDVYAALRKVLVAATDIIGGRGITVWLCEKNAFQCFLHYDVRSKSFSKDSLGESVTKKEFLRAIRGKSALVTGKESNGAGESRIARNSIFDKKDISAAVDVPMHSEGRLLGYLSLEEINQKRSWFDDEVYFICTIANYCSLIFQIDEKRNLETEAKQTRDELVRLIDTANAPICGIDVNGKVNEWNQAVARITGYDKEEVVGRDFLSLIKREQESSAKRIINIALAGGNSENFELTLPTKSGEEVVILLNATPRKNLDGQIIGVVGVGQDITEIFRYRTQMEQLVAQKTAELNSLLQKSNAERSYLDAILNSAVDGIIATDKNGQVVLANQAAESIAQNFSDTNDCVEVFLSSNEGYMREEILAVNQGINTIYRGQIVLEGRKTGQADMVLSATTASLEADDSGIKGAVTILRDTTSEVEIDRMKTEFVSTAAHELRTPLTTIQGFSEILLTRDSLEENAKKHYLEMIHTQSLKLGALINDLLDLSRMEQGQAFHLNKALCLPGEVVTTLLQSLEPSAKNHSFKLTVAEGLPEILVDKDKMGQVMTNLLSNAIKYSPEGGEIRITLGREERFLKLTVADSGIGMTENQIRHVFDKFYRVDATNSAIEGTGLGMPIVKCIIEAHNGNIWLESSLGVGTVVHILLPYEDAYHVEKKAWREEYEQEEDSYS